MVTYHRKGFRSERAAAGLGPSGLTMNYNDFLEIPYMCLLIIMYSSLTTMIPQQCHTCVY